jgi:hypothetical protein
LERKPLRRKAKLEPEPIATPPAPSPAPPPAPQPIIFSVGTEEKKHIHRLGGDRPVLLNDYPWIGFGVVSNFGRLEAADIVMPNEQSSLRETTEGFAIFPSQESAKRFCEKLNSTVVDERYAAVPVRVVLDDHGNLYFVSPREMATTLGISVEELEKNYGVK